MNRRQVIQTIGLGGAGYVATAAFTAPACSPKSVNAEIVTVEAFLKVVATEIPSQSATITKILKIADDFNNDYQRGDFVNAASVFANLEVDVTQLISDLGLQVSSRVKMALVLVDAGITAIASLLKSQASVPAVKAARASATANQINQANAIEKRAARVDKLFQAIH